MMGMIGMIAPAAVDPATAAAQPSVLSDMLHLAPMMVVAAWSLLQLAADAFAGPGGRLFQRRLALVGLGLAAAAAASQFGDWQYDAGVVVFSGFLSVDQFALLLDLAILAIAASVIAFSGDYARSHRFEYGEHETLVFIAAFGMMILVHAANLLAIFLGIETMSIAIYVLVGARWNSRLSSEAALKYFIMGAFASGLLVMGMALLYGATGTFDLTQMHRAVTRIFTEWGKVQPYVDTALHPPTDAPPEAVPDIVRDAVSQAVPGIAPAALFFPGMLLVLGALMFKISAVPLHMWTPDAYEGAPTPTTGFMAAGVKIGGFAALLKLFVATLGTHRLVTAPYGWTSVLALIAFLTMTVGNLAAVRQTNVKRLLAYSSIAHVGYLLLGVIAAANFYGQSYVTGEFKSGEERIWAQTTGDLALGSVLFYLVAYAVATLGAFACVAWFGADKKEGNAAHEWSGVAQRHPAMALGMTICLLALMGMPPTAGFFGKLFVFRAAFENDNWVLRWLVVAALLNSVIGAYYYLRLIVAMYFRPPPEREIQTLPGRGVRLVVGLAAAASLALGIFANPLMRRAHLGAAGFAHPPGAESRGEWVDRLRAKWEEQDTETIEPTDQRPTDEGTPAAAEADDAPGENEAPEQAAGAAAPEAAP